MQVRFQNTPDDFRLLRRQAPWTRRWGDVLAVIFMAWGSVAPSLLLGWLLDQPVLLGCSILLGFALCLGFLLGQRAVRSGVLDEPPTERVVDLDDDGLMWASRRGWTRSHWGRVKELRRVDGRLLLYLDEFTALVVPESAFADPTACEQFVAFVRRSIAEPPPLERFTADARRRWSSPTYPDVPERTPSASSPPVLDLPPPEVEYSLTWADYQAMWRFHADLSQSLAAHGAAQTNTPPADAPPLQAPPADPPPPNTWGRGLILVGASLVWLILPLLDPDWWFDGLETLFSTLFCVLNTLGMLSLFSQSISLWFLRRQRRYFQSLDRAHTRFRLSPSGVADFTGHTLGWISWSEVEALHLRSSHVFLTLRRTTSDPLVSFRMFVVPLSSFTPSSPLPPFLSYIRSHLTTFSTSAPTSPVETGNPFQSPQHS